MIQKDTYTPVFIVALFTTAKTWKQPKCPLMEKWINKTCYIYTMDYYSAIKNTEITPFAAIRMDLNLSFKARQARKRQIPSDATYMWTLKYNANELTSEIGTDSQPQRTDLWFPRRRWMGRLDGEFGVTKCKLLYIGWVNCKVLLHSTEIYSIL